METIKINNRLHLIANFTKIEVKVICPKKNIQKMLLKTNSKFISKKEIELRYNHNGGQIFEVTILARFIDVKNYLYVDTVYNAENYDFYKNLVAINNFYSNPCYTNEITSLYAFGEVYYDAKENYKKHSYTRYYRNDGYSILRFKTDYNNFGKKRYIKTGKGWLSNRDF